MGGYSGPAFTEGPAARGSDTPPSYLEGRRLWFQRAVEVNSIAALFYLRETSSWFPRHPNPPVLGQPLSLSAEREECSHPQLPDEKTEAQRGEGAYLRAHRKREAESGQQPQPLVPRPAPSWASPPLCPAKLKLRLFKRRTHLLCTSFVPHIFLGRSSGLVRLYCEFQLGFFCPLVFLFLFCCAVQHARISVP